MSYEIRETAREMVREMATEMAAEMENGNVWMNREKIERKCEGGKHIPDWIETSFSRHRRQTSPKGEELVFPGKFQFQRASQEKKINNCGNLIYLNQPQMWIISLPSLCSTDKFKTSINPTATFLFLWRSSAASFQRFSSRERGSGVPVKGKKYHGLEYRCPALALSSTVFYARAGTEIDG